MLAVDVALALRDAGHDVVRASETGHSRADDLQILEWSINSGRILITLDEHFGDWVILPLSSHPGVVRIKVHPTLSNKVIDLVVPFLGRYEMPVFENHLVILSPKREKWIRTN
jgi:predicted nuclease of predicted toxin-antitoxin system